MKSHNNKPIQNVENKWTKIFSRFNLHSGQPYTGIKKINGGGSKRGRREDFEGKFSYIYHAKSLFIWVKIFGQFFIIQKDNQAFIWFFIWQKSFSLTVLWCKINPNWDVFGIFYLHHIDYCMLTSVIVSLLYLFIYIKCKQKYGSNNAIFPYM